MSKEYDKDFENSETSDLNKLLKKFYFNIRRINGEYYNRIIRQSMASPLQQHAWYHDWWRISRGQQYIRIYVQETTKGRQRTSTR
jgi:hypothetical protein